MADPIATAEQSEYIVRTLTATFRARVNPFVPSITAPRPRQPTLFERYRSEARGQSFGAWLKVQGLA